VAEEEKTREGREGGREGGVSNALADGLLFGHGALRGPIHGGGEGED